MSSVNKVIILGHLGDNVKIHRFEGGNCVGRVPIATSSSFVNKTTNERTTETEWHNLVFWGKGAEAIEKYTKKGDKLYIEGRIKTRAWQTEQGETRYTTEIHVQEFSFIERKQDTTQQPAQQSTGHAGDDFLNMKDNVPPEQDLPF